MEDKFAQLHSLLKEFSPDEQDMIVEIVKLAFEISQSPLSAKMIFTA